MANYNITVTPLEEHNQIVFEFTNDVSRYQIINLLTEIFEGEMLSSMTVFSKDKTTISLTSRNEDSVKKFKEVMMKIYLKSAELNNVCQN